MCVYIPAKSPAGESALCKRLVEVVFNIKYDVKQTYNDSNMCSLVFPNKMKLHIHLWTYSC